MEIYYEKKPQTESGLKRALKYIPPFAFWYMAKAAFNAIFGLRVGNIVSDGQVIFKNDGSNKDDANNRFKKSFTQMEAEYETKIKENSERFTFNKYSLHTFDKQRLNSLEIFHKINPEEKKYFVHFVGKGVIFENHLEEMIKNARELDCNVVTYNYRGVLNSSGKATNYKQLVNDGIAQVQRLIDKGVNPENIILYGHCLGAEIATLTADYMHQKGNKVYLFADRSFSSIPNFTSGIFELAFEQKAIPYVGRVLDAIVNPILKGFTRLCGWEMNIVPAFKRIPEQYKDYTVIRSSKEERKKRLMMDDGIIHPRASIHYAIKHGRSIKRHFYMQNIKYAKKLKCNDKNNKNADEIIHENMESLRAIDAHKFKGYPNSKKENVFDVLRKDETEKLLHTGSLERLQNRVYNENGQEYLADFVNKIQGKKVERSVNQDYLKKERAI